MEETVVSGTIAYSNSEEDLNQSSKVNEIKAKLTLTNAQVVLLRRLLS